jgi:type II restriction/modification system DNA methylase subunit YeeA
MQGKLYALEAEWPEADFIIGNPSFVGDKRMRAELGDDYVIALRTLYAERVPGGADLVTYWFEKAREQIAAGKAKRAGLLATQGIRGGANRKVLERILEGGGIFLAWSDREWILDGANVHVSIVGFDNGSQVVRAADGRVVEKINANLTSEADTTSAAVLPENAGICFVGPSPHGSFDIDHETAGKMLASPLNVNGRPNSDVVRPVASAVDLVRRSRNVWTIDFGTDRSMEQAAQYEMPFEYVKAKVYPERKDNHRESYRERWWIYAEARPGMRRAIDPLERYIATPRVSKHRLFVWQEPRVLCNDGTIVLARDDDYFFGMLQSRLHEVWARAQGTQLREAESGFRYTPTSTFETFPFPWAPGKEAQDNPLVQAIAQSANELVTKRDAWLNPPDAKPETLAKRTLTNLYNERPSWLADLHRKLDHAVFAAYGWPSSLTDAEVLERLLALNHERAALQG